MPHTLSLEYQPALRQYATRVPLWRRLLGIADAAVEQLMLLWHGLFQDARSRVQEDALVTALGVHLLEGRSYVAAQWEQAVERPARRLFPVLAEDVVDEAGDVQASALSTLLHVEVPYVRGTADTEQWVQQYVGTEVRDVTQTSMQTVQHVLRGGMLAGLGARMIARDVRQALGLTPRQQRAIETLRQRLTTQGVRAADIRRQVRDATTRGLAQRAKVIAAHEALTLAHQGAHEATVQAVQRGAMAAAQVRRHWVITAGACATVCVPIRGMNPPGGVGLYEAFETPAGPFLYPPVHVNCRCSVSTTIVGRP
jgi:hypothetical protein